MKNITKRNFFKLGLVSSILGIGSSSIVKAAKVSESPKIKDNSDYDYGDFLYMVSDKYKGDFQDFIRLKRCANGFPVCSVRTKYLYHGRREVFKKAIQRLRIESDDQSIDSENVRYFSVFWENDGKFFVKERKLSEIEEVLKNKFSFGTPL